MPIINRFDGGLVTGLDPVHLETKQSTVLLDANIESIGLSSAKEPVEFTDGQRSFYQFPVLDSEPEAFHVTSSANQRTYAEFQGNLLYSDGGPVCQYTTGQMNAAGDDFKWINLGIGEAEGPITARVITVEADIPGATTTLTVYSLPGTGWLVLPTINYRVVDADGTVYCHAVANNSGFSTVAWTLPTATYKVYREELGRHGSPTGRYRLVSENETSFTDGLTPDFDVIIAEREEYVPSYGGHRMAALNGASWTAPCTFIRTWSYNPCTCTCSYKTTVKVGKLRSVDFNGTWKSVNFNKSITSTTSSKITGGASIFVYNNAIYVQLVLGNETRIYSQSGTLVFKSSTYMNREFLSSSTVEASGKVYFFDVKHGKVAIFNGSTLTYRKLGSKFPYAEIRDTPIVIYNGLAYAIINDKSKAFIRTINLSTFAIGYAGKQRISLPKVRGLGGTSNSNLVKDGMIIFPVYYRIIEFTPATNMLADNRGESTRVRDKAIKGFTYHGYFYHSIQGVGSPYSCGTGKETTSLATWGRNEAEEAIYFDERTLTGTYIYNVAQRNPGDTGEGNIMETESEPVTVIKGHIRVDTSQIIHTEPLRLYRTGGYLTRWTMVEDIDLPEDYIDKRDDVTIALGRNGLVNFGDAPPEESKYLTSHRGRVFAAVDNKLYWSEAGNADLWDELLSFVICDRDITGLASCGNGLLIFMRGRIALLLGDSRNSFALRTVSVEKGTADSYSIQEASNGAFFFSADGLCFTDGSQIMELSYNILGPREFNVIDSTATNRSYYALVKTFVESEVAVQQQLLRYDFGKEAVFSTLRGDEITGLGTIFGRVAHASSNDKIYDTLAGQQRMLNYKSGNITEGVPSMVKEWDRVRLAGEFNGQLIISIEDVAVIRQDLALVREKLMNIHIPKSMNKGKTISFELVGRGFVASIEYSLTGRTTTK